MVDEEDERSLLLNLKRVMGNISCVTVDCVFELLAQIQNRRIHELHFIEEGYTSCVFGDDEFLESCAIHICSIEVLLKRYEEAKSNSDISFLSKLHTKHREARAFLNDETVKVEIKRIIRDREIDREWKAFSKILHSCIDYVRHFRNQRPNAFDIVMQFIPRLSAVENFQQITDSQDAEKNS